ncbi:hypothetical protein D187_005239 [Cystobacter fuscus DSM 2262]|uniref:Uncharacterized protein n=1 Tax=Cystobacter fuscus (strain ATCC 25194 / DSM 2262 / NBRC 100088 / M29) TaxID=1242864 RepID=S9PM95_CYSF2|nr:hypothetical protein [Cystobacter fuscus]EPX64106.1 hypothetical protein D187_005239 [Cystobacter fuscus DSM 2262]
MIRYAWASGIPLTEELQQSLDALDLSSTSAEEPPLSLLSEFHGGLARVVAPATPRTIHLLETDPYSGTALGILGPLPNIRRLMVAALCFITLFIAFAQSKEINRVNLQKLFSELEGTTLLIVLGFYMSAAGLGACFNSLFTAHSYVSKRIYDPRYDSSYWIRMALGVIAGLMLAQLIPIDNGNLSGSGNPQGVDLAKPLLALLGGFSASLVYTILHRLVDTVESLFRSGKAEAAVADREVSGRGKAPVSTRILAPISTPTPGPAPAPEEPLASTRTLAPTPKATSTPAPFPTPTWTPPSARPPAPTRAPVPDPATKEPPTPVRTPAPAPAAEESATPARASARTPVHAPTPVLVPEEPSAPTPAPEPEEPSAPTPASVPEEPLPPPPPEEQSHPSFASSSPPPTPTPDEPAQAMEEEPEALPSGVEPRRRSSRRSRPRRWLA